MKTNLFYTPQNITMKKTIALLLFFFASSHLFAQANKRITLQNQTGYTIIRLYVSPGSEEWNDTDQLGEEVIANADEFEIRVNTTTDCEWDFKAIDEDEDAYVLRQDVCENATVIFSNEHLVTDDVTAGGDAEAEADEPIMEEPVSVTFQNKTGKEIVIINWIIDGMQDEMDFSEDILGEENTLEAGETEEINFIVPLGTCDLIFLFQAEGETSYRKEVNLCPIGETIQITRADKLEN